MNCRTCNRPSSPRTQWVAPSGDRFCCVWCMDAHLGNKIMIDPTGLERAAMDHAGEQAGEYMETLGKTDLATFSPDEFGTFINVICTAYIEHLGNAIGRAEADLRYLRNKIEPIPA